MKGISFVWALVFVLCVLFCGYSHAEAKEETVIAVKDTLSYGILGKVEKGRIVISDDVDLKGGVCKLPKRMTLLFKNGVVRNGTLIGNMTRIDCKGKTFDRVTIKGSWNVPEISTMLFADLSYENSLRDVVALAHPGVQNRIVIEKGDYRVRAEKESRTCIPICSNTDLIVNGTIRLTPNDLGSYNIIQAKGEHINIEGKGAIIGDKHRHTGTEGEWGMGINLKGAVNATIIGLTIKDCWGDCIYVGGNSRSVLIEKCTLDHGRRQGISVTKASGVTVRNCTITNVGGTAPEYAIDIEPNRRDSVDNILIERVTVKDCKGGFHVTRGLPKDGAKTPWIGQVTIRNCQVASLVKRPVSIKRCEEVKIEKCFFYAHKGRTAISVTETAKAVVQNNTVSIDGSIIEMAKNGAKKLMGKAIEPIHVKVTGQSIMKDNKVIER